MALSRGSRSHSPSRLRRKTSWQVGPASGSVAGGEQILTSSTATIMLQGGAVNVDGITLVRTRGEFNIALTAATAATDGFHGAFGIGLVSLPAFNAGIASVPTPVAEEDWEGWLYHRYFSLFSGGVIDASSTSSDNQANPTCAALRVEIDSKAMRKLGEDMVLYAAVELTETGTATASIFMDSRVLIKLP